MNAYENVVRAAFYDELRKISSGGEKIAATLTESALLAGALGGGAGAVHGALIPGNHFPGPSGVGLPGKNTWAKRGLIGAALGLSAGAAPIIFNKAKYGTAEEFLHYAKLAGVGPFGRAPGIFQSFGKDLMAGGKMLGAQKLVSPGTFAPAGLAQRTVGEMASSAGHHYAHKSTLGNVLNPLGGAVGGMAEGLTRAGGKELTSAGHNVGGRMGNAMRAGGAGLQRVAKGVGAAGEVAGLAGLGTALGAPLSAAGLLGGKALGAAAPGLEHALHHTSQAAHHAVSDITGTAGHGIMDRARKAFGLVQSAPAAPRTGYSLLPPAMAHA